MAKKKYTHEGKAVRTSHRVYTHAVGCRNKDGTFTVLSCCGSYALAVKAQGSSDVRRYAGSREVEIVELVVA